MEIKKVVAILEQIKTTHKPFKVRTTDYEVYFGKLPSHNDDPCVVNELLAAFLLKSWRIHTPDVCLLDFGDNEIVGEIQTGYKINTSYLLGFGSKQLPDVIDFNIFLSPHGISTKGLFRDDFIISYLKIALFDIWVENTDRHKKNSNLLIRETRTNISAIPIDHVTILYPAYDSQAELLNYFEYYNNLDYTLLGTDFMSLIRNRFFGTIDLHLIFDDYFIDSVNTSKKKYYDFIEEYRMYFNPLNNYFERVEKLLFGEKRNAINLKKFYASIEI